MPLLFAATLFVSASLLFMIQPMVAKMVLPLLGGSPAVWNACMVFFQALLLLGYLYAHHVTGKYNPRRQWLIHVAFLGVPLVAFIAAVVFGPRHSPIAIAESLAPTGESSSPILSVLALLTVAIGIPFLVISTSAPLLQKWFEYTGHPSARDPYFLYGASNLGSMISLLGYPLFIEPHLSIVGQAWLFGLGFVVLAVMAFFCGQAAANPIGVPPPSAQNRGGKSLQKVNQQNNGNANQLAPTDPFPPSEAPPSLVRKVKWVTLAFIPSSLMLGVTFHISTDIASIPLIWVIPLALYLATFIIAFGNHPFATFLGAFALFGFTVMGIYFPNYFVFAVALVAVVAAGPIFGLDWGKALWRFLSTQDHFRTLIGNLAPVAILLLVFVMTSGVLGDNSKFGLTLGLYIVTFFLAALMCHYELVRDRPSPQYLTQFYLLMSVGGVLGGIFNSLIAPLIFPQAYEFKIVLVLACLMVPVLSETADPEEDSSVASILEHVIYAIIGALLAPIVVLFELSLAILGVGQSKAERPQMANSTGETGSETGGVEPGPRTEGMLAVMAAALFLVISWFLLLRSELLPKYAVALVFVLFLLLARLMLKPIEQTIRKNWESIGSRQRSYMLDGAVGVLLGVLFYFLTQLPHESESFANMCTRISETLKFPIDKIKAVLIYAIPVMICFFFVDRPLRFALCVAAILGYGIYQEDTSDVIYSERSFFGILKIEEQESPQRPAFWTEDGKFVVSGLITYNRLVHGTTLHGTQIREMKPNVFDMFQAINPLNPWENIAVAGANHLFDPRQEPLTYYHRTGPVGAMFRELRSRKGGADAKADFGMVGLGTGSVSCYALPGQRLTFYEIDPAVKRLVADTDKYFTYVTDARNRGAKVDIRMGDARLKLQEDEGRRYSLLLVDAFSSDSIPVHLLTKEAVQLYFNRMTEDGILALHISNRWIRLEPVVAAIVEELRKEPGFENLTARLWSDNSEKRPGKTASSWIVLTKNPEALGTMAFPEKEQLEEYNMNFQPLKPLAGLHAWTDDYSDVMRVMDIKEIIAIRSFFNLPTLKKSDDDR